MTLTNKELRVKGGATKSFTILNFQTTTPSVAPGQQTVCHELAE